MPQFLSGEAACQPRPLGIAQIACAFSWNQRGGASYFCFAHPLARKPCPLSGRCSSAWASKWNRLRAIRCARFIDLSIGFIPKVVSTSGSDALALHEGLFDEEVA